MQMTAAARLEEGDQILARLGTSTSPSTLAVELHVSVVYVEKAAWLARAFTPADRDELGAVLDAVTPSHLEAVAKLPAAVRIDLLRRAHEGNLSVRAMKAIAAQAGDAAGDGARGAPDLQWATKAVQMYARLDGRGLGHLLGGPNGSAVTSLVKAAVALGRKIEEVRGPGHFETT